MQTRRTFLQRSLSAAGAALALGTSSFAEDQSAPILVNHLGWIPSRAKYFLCPGDLQRLEFSVVHSQTGQIVQKGVMLRGGGDLGKYLVGDISALESAGQYEIHVPGYRVTKLTIDAQIHGPVIRKCVSYFGPQRCGDSRSGFHSPCHLDDGKRSDNGQHLDVSGGWHDACDLRKWVDATIYGMVGLARALDLDETHQNLDRAAVIDELRWGNSYFRKMQDSSGFVMNYCGGDDGNFFTDNKQQTADDRLIHVEPAELPAQFHFIAAQAAMSRLTQKDDRTYARACAESAIKCLHWCEENRSPGAATSLGAAILACIELHRALKQRSLQDSAAKHARKLMSLQVTTKKQDAINGFFLSAIDRPEPLREIQAGNLPGIALGEILKYFPEHPEAPAWHSALALHADYLSSMSMHSPFGIIPFGLYSARDPGGGRRIGSYWYRWFMKPNDEYRSGDWWVGINAHLASNGIALAKASRLLHQPKLMALAQRQLDWILGVNPFDASTMTGVGFHQPPLYRTNQFKPNTPLIPGGVMNGIGGSARDEPVLLPGSYHTCEYWTPMVAYAIWLLSELQND